MRTYLKICLHLVWIALLPVSFSRAQNVLPWTVLIPERDSRDAEVRDFDSFDSTSLVSGMNATEDAFHHKLVRTEVPIRDLLKTSTFFCELRFDAVTPLILTDEEKRILVEYFERGGFILFQEDAYPYSEDEFWAVKQWPVIDFITKELPGSDFKIEKITDAHALFHQLYNTKTATATMHELRDNPYSPNRTFITYRGHPCAFVFGRYSFLEDGKWVASPRPFRRVFSMDPRGYELSVNVYAYALTH